MSLLATKHTRVKRSIPRSRGPRGSRKRGVRVGGEQGADECSFVWQLACLRLVGEVRVKL